MSKAVTVGDLSSGTPHDGRTDVARSVVRESGFESEDPGLDPLSGQKKSCSVPSESTLAQTSLCLTPVRVYGTHPNVCAC